jgi:hypothetical protein
LEFIELMTPTALSTAGCWVPATGPPLSPKFTILPPVAELATAW